jgi:hypothetical protein
LVIYYLVLPHFLGWLVGASLPDRHFQKILADPKAGVNSKPV